MEAYHKKIDHLEVKMLVEMDVKNVKTSWDIYLYNSKKDSVLIEHLETNDIYIEGRDVLRGDIRNCIIVGDVILVDKTIYLMLYDNGNTYLYTYEFTDSKTFTKKECFAGYHFMISYENFGYSNYSAFITKVTEHDLVINTFDRGYFPLLKYNILTNKITRINFNEETIVKVKDTEEVFKTLDLNQHKEKVGLLIKDVLIASKYLKTTDAFTYLENVDRSRYKYEQRRLKYGIIYFFYRVNDNDYMNIIRYNIRSNEWLIGDFYEEKIKDDGPPRW